MPSLFHGDAELSYTVSGDGPPIVFLQGVGLMGLAWSPQTAALSSAHRCITIDNRGIGGSRGDTSKLSVEQMARDALAVLDALGIESAHLVGHSLGGVIVQCLALLAPTRAKSLTFMCTFAGGRDLASPSAKLIWLGTRSRVGTQTMRKRAFARLIMPDAYLALRGIDRVVEELEAVFGRSLAASLPISDVQLRALRAHDDRQSLSRLSGIPSLVLSGKHDPIATPAANAALAAGIGTATHRVWDDASHALPIQHARPVNEALIAHVASAR